MPSLEGNYQSVQIPIIYYDHFGKNVREEKLEGGAFVPVIVVQANGKLDREKTIRATINQLSGLQKKVMIDLYRFLHFTTFTSYEGKRGKSAETFMSREFPDQGTLAGFARKSAKFNASGEIAFDVMLHKKNGHYRVLGGILVSLLETGVMDTPAIDER